MSLPGILPIKVDEFWNFHIPKIENELLYEILIARFGYIAQDLNCPKLEWRCVAHRIDSSPQKVGECIKTLLQSPLYTEEDINNALNTLYDVYGISCKESEE